LPGEYLYPLKGFIEDTRLKFSLTDTSEFQLHLDLARARIEELDVLLEEGNVKDVSSLLNAVLFHINEANAILEQISLEDPEIAEKLLDVLQDAFDDYESILLDLLKIAPEGLKEEILQILQVVGIDDFEDNEYEDLDDESEEDFDIEEEDDLDDENEGVLDVEDEDDLDEDDTEDLEFEDDLEDEDEEDLDNEDEFDDEDEEEFDDEDDLDDEDEDFDDQDDEQEDSDDSDDSEDDD
jgi:hypothetical protein